MAIPLKESLWLKLWMWSQIPMLHFVRPQVLSLNQQECSLLIPLRRRTKNHLKSMYLGVLVAGADLVSGVLAFKLAREDGRTFRLVFKGLSAEFHKRAMHDVLFTCKDGKKILQMVEKAKKSGERVNEDLTVTASCPHLSEEVVATFTMTLSLRIEKKSEA